MRRPRTYLVVGKLWSGHIAGAKVEFEGAAKVGRWFRWGEGVGECGRVKEYAGISIQLAG